MNTKYFIIALLFSGLFVLDSCIKPPPGSDDEPVRCPVKPDSYQQGIFVVNRGSEERAGSISFLYPENEYRQNNVFFNENNETKLGPLVFSFATYGNIGYIIENLAGKIVMVNLNDFKKIGEITGFEQPRYFLPVGNNKAYVSQWGADGSDGSIKIIDLVSNTITGTINTANGPDRMKQLGLDVYVATSGGFLIENVVQKVSTIADEVVKTITVGDVPESLQIDKFNRIWVLTRGVIDDEHPETNTKGGLHCIQDDQLILSMELATGAEDLIINKDRDMLYFNMNSWVYSHPIQDITISLTTFIDQYFVGLGIDPKSGIIYGGSGANTFVTGQVVSFDENGIEIDRWTAQFGPSEFWFE